MFEVIRDMGLMLREIVDIFCDDRATATSIVAGALGTYIALQVTDDKQHPDGIDVAVSGATVGVGLLTLARLGTYESSRRTLDANFVGALVGISTLATAVQGWKLMRRTARASAGNRLAVIVGMCAQTPGWALMTLLAANGLMGLTGNQAVPAATNVQAVPQDSEWWLRDGRQVRSDEAPKYYVF